MSEKAENIYDKADGATEPTSPTSPLGFIEEAILLQIAKGQHVPGDKLPSCRQLGGLLSVSHNTVYSSYRHLEQRGIVEAVHGSGFRLVNTNVGMQDLTNLLKRRLKEIIVQARQTGYSQAQVQQAFEHSLKEMFDDQVPTVAFIECSHEAASRLADHLQRRVLANVRPVVMPPDVPALQRAVFGADVICTTLYHLAEVEEMLKMHNQVIGIKHVPETEGLLQVARLEKGAHVLLLGRNQRTVDNLAHTMNSYHVDVASAVLLDDTTQEDFEQADVVVTTIELRNVCRKLVKGHTEVIYITYSVDPQSVDYLRKRVNQVAATIKS